MKRIIHQGYYAIFDVSSDAVIVEFPELPGCLTSGRNMEEAFEYAIDALAGWLECADDEHIPKKILKYTEIQQDFPGKQIMRVPVDSVIMKQYEEKQRFNASFPKSVLARVDSFAEAKGWNRSQFLIRASEKLIAENSV